jgi:hypothetical protein
MSKLFTQRQLGIWYFHERLKNKQSVSFIVLEAINALSSCVKNMDNKKKIEFYRAIRKFLRGWGIEPVPSKYRRLDEYDEPYWVLNRDLENLEIIRKGCNLDEDGEEKTID